jgi:hypothetical protein
MQTRGRARTEWRLSVYRTTLEQCAAGGFSLARFVAIPPERLLLGAAEAAGGLPIWIDPSLSLLIEDGLAELAGSLQTAPGADAPLPPESPAVGPALDLASLDGRIEPRRLGAFLQKRGLRLEKALCEALTKCFALVGRAPNGEEVALLGLYAIQQALVAAAQQASPGAHSPLQAIASLLLERACAQASEHPSVDAKAFAQRAALRAGLLQSHYAFQRSIDGILSTPINTYRTQHVAVQAARSLLRGEADLRAADDAIDRIAGAVLSVPAAVELCWIEAAMELVREALLEPYLCVPLPPPLTALLSQVVSEPAFLAELLSDHEQREKLIFALARISPPGPFKPAVDTLKAIGAARGRRKAGDPPAPLPQGGTVGKLAGDQARGAYLMAADSAVRRLFAPLEASLRPAEGVVAEREWKRGQRYRFGAGPEPVVNAPSDPRQAHLCIDLREVTGAAERLLGAGAPAAELLHAQLFEPLLAEAARLRSDSGDDDEALALGAFSQQGLTLRGEVLPLLELLQFASAQVGRVRATLEQAAEGALDAAALQTLRAAEQESHARGEARRLLQAQLEEHLPDHEREAVESRLREAAAAEGESLGHLNALRAASLGPCSASIFLSHGPPAAALPVRHADLGGGTLTVGGAAQEAQAGCGRDATLGALRAAWSALAGGMPLAFAVTCGPVSTLALSPNTSADVAAALAAGDQNAALRALAGHFRELQAELSRVGALPGVSATSAVYNEGAALSSEALTALQAATSGSLAFVEKNLGPTELHPALLAELSFPHGEALLLTVALDAETRQPVHCFRYAGTASLALGAEERGVWELCDPRGAFVQLFARHHLAAG